MIRLFLDEDSLSGALIGGLRRVGIDVLTVVDAERQGMPDDAQLQFATETRRVLLTANGGDFLALHTIWLREGRRHSGIVVRSQQTYSIGQELRALGRLAEAYEPDDFIDVLVYLSAWVST